MPQAPAARPSTLTAPKAHEKPAQKSGVGTAVAMVVAALAFIGLGLVAPPSFLAHLTVFVLACIVGWQVVWNVTPALHTPLMSVTNAISGIIVDWRHAAGERPALRPGSDFRWRRDPAGHHQHRRWVPRHPTHAEDVQPPMMRVPADLTVKTAVLEVSVA